MFRAIIFSVFFALTAATHANAQAKDVWIQVEARPSQSEAIARIHAYETLFPMIGGFKLANGWFAIAIGPFTESEAEHLLSQFVKTGLIPRDSYIFEQSGSLPRFYPPRNATTETVVESEVEEPAAETEEPVAEETAAAEPVTEEPHPAVIPEIPDETVAEARASERLLSRAEKMELQKALAWAGHYTSAIDGLYGRGTRASMESYQAQKGYEQTGVLTTLQRAALLEEYNAIFDGLDLGLVSNSTAGISVEMPRDVLHYSSTQAPFVHYEAVDGSDAAVHLISMPGDRNTLYALMDVMQSLEIVPLGAKVKRNRNNFAIEGQNRQIYSYSEAYLDGGQIKGFTLVWPNPKQAQFERLVERMQLSFITTTASLQRGQSPAIEPGQEYLAGLVVRQPSILQSGVFLNDAGQILTSARISDRCAKIEIMDEFAYRVESTSAELGLSVLTPLSKVSPLGHATLRSYPNKNDSEVAVAGYAFGGILGAPTLTFGRISSTKGLSGETHLDRLTMPHFDADIGGAVLGNTGELVGLLLGQPDTDGRVLPAEVSFMTDNVAIKEFLINTDVEYSIHNGILPKDALDLERDARNIAVWIKCWE